MPTFAAVRSRNIYPGIDLTYRGAQGRFEYDLEVSADADPAFVRRVFLRFGDAGRGRLQDELANASGSRRETVAEIIRIMGDSDDLA